MSFLLDVPFVLSLATWVWGGDPAADTSAELCIQALPWMTTSCWSRLLVKGLGIGIILGSCLNKMPIMLNIWNTKSTAGLSRTAVYGESIVYSNCALYGLLESFPISSYGENIAMTIQSVLIVILIWKFTDHPPVQMRERVLAVLFAILYVGAVVAWLPSQWHYLLMASIWPIQVVSRGSQIIQTHRLQHTGAQSVITTSMNLFGSMVRILTTIKEVGWDLAVLMGYFLSISLNLIMFVQYWLYQRNTTAFLRALQEKKGQ